jgi:hypothetical protein
MLSFSIFHDDNRILNLLILSLIPSICVKNIDIVGKKYMSHRNCRLYAVDRDVVRSRQK